MSEPPTAHSELAWKSCQHPLAVIRIADTSPLETSQLKPFLTIHKLHLEGVFPFPTQVLSDDSQAAFQGRSSSFNFMRSLPSYQTDMITKTRKLMKGAHSVTLSAVQRVTLVDPEVKGASWVSLTSFPAPRDETSGPLSLLERAVEALGDGMGQYTRPSVENVDARWTGYRLGVGEEKPEPSAFRAARISGYDEECQVSSHHHVFPWWWLYVCPSPSHPPTTQLHVQKSNFRKHEHIRTLSQSRRLIRQINRRPLPLLPIPPRPSTSLSRCPPRVSYLLSLPTPSPIRRLSLARPFIIRRPCRRQRRRESRPRPHTNPPIRTLLAPNIPRHRRLTPSNRRHRRTKRRSRRDCGSPFVEIKQPLRRTRLPHTRHLAFLPIS